MFSAPTAAKPACAASDVVPPPLIIAGAGSGKTNTIPIVIVHGAAAAMTKRVERLARKVAIGPADALFE